MKRNWDAFTEFLFQFGFSRAICLGYMCSFTFYSVLSFLISHIVLFFAHLHQFILFFSFPFSFTLSLTFLGRSFVGLVKSKYIKNGNIFNLSFSLFSEFFLCVCFWVGFFFMHGLYCMITVISWPFRERVREFFCIFIYAVTLLVSNLFRLVLFLFGKYSFICYIWMLCH